MKVRADPARYLGIDGCRGGWLAAGIDDNDELNFQVLSRLDELTAPSAPFPGVKAVLIDIPLGFPEKEYRCCDREARKLLGPNRGASVFYTPVKSAVYEGSYQEACAKNENALGKKFSKQTWNICVKIREANDFLHRISSHPFPNSQDERLPFPALREAHPELCFLGWSGTPCTHNKKSLEGIIERREIIARQYPDFPSIINHAISKTPRSIASVDDFLDAAILAITATKHETLTSVPHRPDYDLQGQRREIVYYSLNTRTPNPKRNRPVK